MNFNKNAYPWYFAATSFLAWLPVFFLYFSSILSLKEVLLLEALYYIAVVFLEVPTGYFSDVVGRRKTLIIGAIFLCLACVFFYLGKDFWILALGQLSFALHMSFVSGTNTVFHFETLQALGEESKYGDREAIVQKYGMIAGGTSALVGGAIAMNNLSNVYIATFIAAVFALILTLKFKEPKHAVEETKAMKNMLLQLSSTTSFLKQKPIGWIFLFYVAIYAITHVPYEFYQPYLEILSQREMLLGLSVPLVSGFVLAGARFVGAFGAAYSMTWSRSIGLGNFLMINILLINLIVLALGLTLSNILVLVVLFRSFPWASIKAPINAIITPAISAGQRATFHSMMSLACRLSFFATLFVLSFFVGHGEETTWPNLQNLLLICFAGGMLAITLLWFTLKNNMK